MLDIPALRKACEAVEHYDGPFRYESRGTMILDRDGNQALDVRGWGRLTGGAALNLSQKRGERVQDKFGEYVATAITALPAALDEIESLRAELAAARAVTAKHVDEVAAKVEAATSLDYVAKIKAERDRAVEALAEKEHQHSTDWYCRRFGIWLDAMSKKSESFARSWGFIRGQMYKSSWLRRLLYSNEAVRTKPCPVHKGRWCGLFGSKPPGCECMVGDGDETTGWIPEGDEELTALARVGKGGA